MSKRSWKRTLINNVTSRSRNSPQENLQEHRHQTGQVSQTPHSEDSFQENLHEKNQVSVRPTRAAKVKFLQNLTNITRADSRDVSQERVEERVANENNEHRKRRLKDLRQCATQSVVNENNKQRKRCLQDMRQSAARRVANENCEQRERRLQDMRQRAARRVANENCEQRERRLKDLRQRAAQRVANENDEQRERRLQDMRHRAAQRVANENCEQRERRLKDLRQRAAQRVANENCEQRERRLQDLQHRAAQRVANENCEQRVRRLKDLRQRAAQRVANENCEQRERRLQGVRHNVYPEFSFPETETNAEQSTSFNISIEESDIESFRIKTSNISDNKQRRRRKRRPVGNFSFCKFLSKRKNNYGKIKKIIKFQRKKIHTLQKAIAKLRMKNKTLNSSLKLLEEKSYVTDYYVPETSFEALSRILNMFFVEHLYPAQH